MSELSGFLYVRLGDYGSRSEGPEYFVQHSKDAAEDVPVKKHAELWLDDTKLKRYLATKVTLTGESSPGGFIYTKIGPLLTTSATTPVAGRRLVVRRTLASPKANTSPPRDANQ